MADPFVHLRVASSYSLRHGAASPAALVEAAAGADMDTLALTDRDGLYGAVRFAKACVRAGIAPVVGVDLAVLPPGWNGPAADADRRAADPTAGLPRVVVYATSGGGWAGLCRLTSQIHLTGERGVPIASEEQLIAAAAGGDLVVLLDADSTVGRFAAQGRRDLAEAELVRWRSAVPDLVVGVSDLQVPGQGVGSLRQAGRLMSLADQLQIPVVLTNAVRMVTPSQAPTIDVLDASRRRLPLSQGSVTRRNAEAWLKPGKQMLELAEMVAHSGGRGPGGAERLLGQTRALALRCRLDPRDDLGLGQIHLPELSVLSAQGRDAHQVLVERCEAGLIRRYGAPDEGARRRLADELTVIEQLGFASYFLTVAQVVDTVRAMGIRCAARGSGAGSLVNYVLEISGVDPLRHGLLMERFLSPLRRALPDIDLDVESARRTEIYDQILTDFGGERVACVAMIETYRVRHAVRDVGAALSLPPAEIDAIAKAFPHVRARDARAAVRDLPELRAAGLGQRRLDLLFELVESLDGLPRHVALHPCGVILSDATLRDRTPVEASFGGYPMSQFDKDDVEDIGLLKLDVLGIRMQSAMAHAVAEIDRTTGERIDLDALGADGFSDRATYDLIASTHTLGCFQIESPGQRELIGKFGPADFGDIIIDISLFRPGPVKSDMIRPFLEARQGFAPPTRIHADLDPVLAETEGVVVFHEQVIAMIATLTGCSLAQGDEARRALGDAELREEVGRWFRSRALARGYAESVVDQAWQVVAAFASFGFCKAHAAAFALPTYQSAWLKTHWPAHFLAGVLTHDPGMYPKRLILEEVRRCGVAVLGLDVNRSGRAYAVEPVGGDQQWGIRLSLADVSGISEAEVSRIIAGQPYRSLADFWARAAVSAPVVENLIVGGAFDALHQIGRAEAIAPHGRLTRRDLLLALADLQRHDRADRRAMARARGLRTPRSRTPEAVQLPLDLVVGDELVASGLPEMTDAERVRAELSVLGMDVSRHVADFYRPLLEALQVTWAKDLLTTQRRHGVLVAGAKVATQTPPVRSGRRVVFLTLDDATGPVDATFFEDVQGPYARTLFDSWMLLVRGDIRRTGPRGVSVLASGCWDLGSLFQQWSAELELTGSAERALARVHQILAEVPDDLSAPGRRMLVHPSGFRQSAYADIRPAGASLGGPAGLPKVWHTSPGSSGR